MCRFPSRARGANFCYSYQLTNESEDILRWKKTTSSDDELALFLRLLLPRVDAIAVPLHCSVTYVAHSWWAICVHEHISSIRISDNKITYQVGYAAASHTSTKTTDPKNRSDTISQSIQRKPLETDLQCSCCVYRAEVCCFSLSSKVDGDMQKRTPRRSETCSIGTILYDKCKWSKLNRANQVDSLTLTIF